jgi:hypothetical protein
MWDVIGFLFRTLLLAFLAGALGYVCLAVIWAKRPWRPESDYADPDVEVLGLPQTKTEAQVFAELQRSGKVVRLPTPQSETPARSFTP